MVQNLQEYIKNTHYDLDNQLDRTVFELDLAEKYLKKYKKFLRKECESEALSKDKKIILKYVPKDIIEHIEFFANLDMEYTEYYPNPFTPVTKTGWRGFWLNSTGMDAELFRNWIYSAVKFDKYKTKTLEYWFHYVNPKIKKTPFAIKMADKIYQKYYKDVK